MVDDAIPRMEFFWIQHENEAMSAVIQYKVHQKEAMSADDVVYGNQYYASKKDKKVPLLRERSILMGILEQEICNGATDYFYPSIIRGH